MRFVDEVTIEVIAGAGGAGSVAFRREKHVPKGGPSGGDGGNGGDIVFLADPGLTTLLDFHFEKIYRAQRGEHGQGGDKNGKSGVPLEIRVPCGTMIFEQEGEKIADMVTPGQRFIAAHGGRGGLGNMNFATSTNQAPRYAQDGKPGEQKFLRLELKLLAEVGLVGLPNAGKSTLISRVSAARPKIADYPFTTLVPTLGMVRLSDDRSFVMADMPGLIEGAHEGIGLGTRFLRHIERTRVLVFLIDDRHELEGTPGSPRDDFELLRRELVSYDSTLLERPHLIVLNKIDALTADRSLEIQRQLAETGLPVLAISGVSGAGVSDLLEAIWKMLRFV